MNECGFTCRDWRVKLLQSVCSAFSQPWHIHELQWFNLVGSTLDLDLNLDQPSTQTGFNCTGVCPLDSMLCVLGRAKSRREWVRRGLLDGAVPSQHWFTQLCRGSIFPEALGSYGPSVAVWLKSELRSRAALAKKKTLRG